MLITDEVRRDIAALMQRAQADPINRERLLWHLRTGRSLRGEFDIQVPPFLICYTHEEQTEGCWQRHLSISCKGKFPPPEAVREIAREFNFTPLERYGCIRGLCAVHVIARLADARQAH